MIIFALLIFENIGLVYAELYLDCKVYFNVDGICWLLKLDSKIISTPPEFVEAVKALISDLRRICFIGSSPEAEKLVFTADYNGRKNICHKSETLIAYAVYSIFSHLKKY